MQLSAIGQNVKFTVCGHDEEDDDGEGPFEVHHEEDQRNSDIEERRKDVEDNGLHSGNCRQNDHSQRS